MYANLADIMMLRTSEGLQCDKNMLSQVKFGQRCLSNDCQQPITVIFRESRTICVSVGVSAKNKKASD
jgi:hypothetical protein